MPSTLETNKKAVWKFIASSPSNPNFFHENNAGLNWLFTLDQQSRALKDGFSDIRVRDIDDRKSIMG